MSSSTKAALVELHRRGILCCIASGPSGYEFPPGIGTGFEGFPGFDAFVSMTGTYCYDAEGVPYYDCPIEHEDVATIVGQVDDGLYEVLVLEGERSYVSGHNPAIRNTEKRIAVSYTEGDIHEALHNQVYQFCAFVQRSWEHTITDACSGVLLPAGTVIFAM